MKLRFILAALCLIGIAAVHTVSGQITAVKYQMRYNTTSCRYDCYIVLSNPSDTTTVQAQRVQFNAQYSLVVPTGTAISVAQNFNPKRITNGTPLTWQISSTVSDPTVTPGRDYISITPNLSPTAAYAAGLQGGDTIRLFSLLVTPTTLCGDSIRIFDNDLDPVSDSLGGGDFDNGFTIGSPEQLYVGNVAPVRAPKPVISALTSCSLGLAIDLTATASSCQSPFKYAWTGPNNYTGITQDVNITNATSANSGNYFVTVTDNLGCTKTLNINAKAKPNGNAAASACSGSSTLLDGIDPLTGLWSVHPSNPSGASIGGTTNGDAMASFTGAALGTYKFIYTDGQCSDTVNISVANQDAGPDPSPVNCYSLGSAVMAANGSGTWSIGSGSAGTATITTPTSSTATVSNFSAPGSYFLVWTTGACKDTALITVNNNCGCAITNNLITQPSTSSYCGTSGAIAISGAVATPAGTYRWQSKTNAAAFVDASGTNNGQNYTTPDLPIGSYSYRRIYTTNSGFICSDTSNVVSFIVSGNTQPPSNFNATPNPVCVGQTVNLSVTNSPGTFVWGASSPNAGLNSSSTNTNTMVPIAPGIYLVSVTNTQNGCTSLFTGANVEVIASPPTPNVNSVIGSNPSSCGLNDGSISLTGLLPNTQYTVNYTFNGNVFAANVTTNGSGTAFILNLNEGSYTNFSLNNAQGCNSGVYVGPVTLSSPSSPGGPTGLAASPNPACLGAMLTLSVDNNPGATYTWTASSPLAGLVPSSTNSTTMVATAAGMYTISVTQTVSGCISNPSTLMVLINPSPPNLSLSNFIANNPSQCGGMNGSIQINGLASNTSYTLNYKKNGVPTSVMVNSSPGGSILVTNLSAASYTDFNLVSSQGCPSNTYAGPVVISDPGSPSAPVGLTALPNALCLGSSVSLSVTNNPGAVYNWSVSPSLTAGLGSSTTNTNTMLPTAVGNYIVNVSQTIAGCTSPAASVNVVVSNQPNPPIGLAANPNPVCQGATANLSVTNTIGATYVWSAPAGAGLVASSTSQTTMVPTSTGDFVISVTQSIGGCSSSAATTIVTVIPRPPIPQNISGNNPSECGLADGSIVISGLPTDQSLQVTYTQDGIPNSINSVVDINGTITINNLPSGTYTNFFLTNANGCFSPTFSGPVILSGPSAPPAPLNLVAVPGSICLGTQIQLSVNDFPGASFNWSASSADAGLQFSSTNTNSMLPLAVGSYTISVTQDIDGCESPAASIVVVVRDDCFHPDFGATYKNIALTGDLNTNDGIHSGITYGSAQALPGNPALCFPSVNGDGTYSFSCGAPGEYYFVVSTCNIGSNSICVSVPLAITVLDQDSNNNPPLANHDYSTTKVNISIAINVRANDKCQTGPACTLGIPEMVILPLHGSYNPNTSVYIPSNGYIGRDSFKYRVCQSPAAVPLNCDEEWVYLSILPATVKNTTNGMDDYNQTYLNVPLSASVPTGAKANDTDIEGHAQSISPQNKSIPGKGTLVLAPDGSYTFTPSLGFTGPVDYPYEVCDNQSIAVCDSATIHLLVNPSLAVGNIGDYVWHDANGDGIQSGGEQGIINTTVQLYSSTGTLIATTVTDGLGKYLFSNVLTGLYYIKFIAPLEYDLTFADRGGNDNTDSDITEVNGANTTNVFLLVAGQTNLSIDGGFYKCSKLGDLVWYDFNKNDVWDPTENGLNGLKVKLYRNHFGVWTLWETQYTGHRPGTPSDDGWYQFCVAPGTYYIAIEVPPTGLVRARPFIGANKSKDSDIDNSNGPNTTPQYTLQSGQNKLDIGAGFYPQAQAGNLVWFDGNENGLQEENEQKVAGVLVKAFDATTNELLGQSVTDAQGLYRINYLEKRDIYLKFTPPTGYSATLANIGNDETNSDVDHSYGANTTKRIVMVPDVYNANIDLGIVNGALPLSWVSVNVKEVDGNHELDWVTTAEINLDNYVVERRAPKESEFTQISSQITPIGTVSASKNYYSFIDDDVEVSGEYIYRIKQVDIDARFTYSRVVSIYRNSKDKVEIYPNPTKNQVNLSIDLEYKTDVSVSLMNTEGKLIKVLIPSVEISKGSHTLSFDISDVSVGIYMIRVDLGASHDYHKLIILE